MSGLHLLYTEIITAHTSAINSILFIVFSVLFLRCHWTVLHHHRPLSGRYVSLGHLTRVMFQSFDRCTCVYQFIESWPLWPELSSGWSEASPVSVRFQNKRACLAKCEAYDVWSSNNSRLYSLTFLSCQAGANNATLMQHGHQTHALIGNRQII